MKLIKYFCLILLLGYTLAFSEPVKPPNWVTTVHLPNNTIAILTWTSVYEGQNSVEKIVIESNSKTIEIFSGYAQPVFNIDNSFVALPYCADDGCEIEIRIIDLVNLSEKRPIKLPPSDQIYIDECKWESRNILRIKVQSYVQPSPMEAFYVYNANTGKLILEKERVYDPFRRN
jgi:hypothetical protein